MFSNCSVQINGIGYGQQTRFTTLRYAALPPYMLSACVRPSVCLSQPVLYRNDWTNQAGFQHSGLLRSILHCVLKKFVHIQNILGTLSQTLHFKKFRHGLSIVAKCFQRNSTKVGAQCEKLSWQYLRRSTFDRRPWPVYHTECSPLCAAQYAWSSASRGSICASRYL